MGRIRDIQVAGHDLAREALATRCDAYGLLVEPVGAWGSREARRVPIGNNTTLSLVHDEREAPFDAADKNLLVSLTDENEVAALVWARPRPASQAVGVGLDLASTSDFAGSRGERFNPLLFSGTEQDFVRERYPGRTEMGFAYAFSAKEAAFKCLAEPLRRWYQDHSEELMFEMREFELADATHERGTLRHAHAQAAMDAMGVRAIELYHCELNDTVLTLAVALT